MNAVSKIALEMTIVRASSLGGYQDCPRRSASRMFRKEIIAAGYELRETTNGIGAAVGTSVHKGGKIMLDEKAKTGELPPISVSTDAAIDTLRAELDREITFDKTTVDLNEAETQVIRMTKVYARDVAPDVQPLLVEERMEATVPWATQGLIVSGQADLVAREPGAIRDTKAGSKLGTYSCQVGTYSLLARSNGIDITEANIDFVKRVHITAKTKTQVQPPAVVQKYNIALAETAAVNVLRHIDGDLKTFREGDPERGLLPGDAWAFPANPSSMLCGEKYCGCYGCKGEHSFCREWEPKEQDE